MDYDFTTSPAEFAANLAAAATQQSIGGTVASAIQAAWDATVQTDPSYQVSAATGELWTVVRVAAVRTE